MPPLAFSYSQFMVFDASVQLPGCDWTDRHTAQGFARRESVVNFLTLLEFGDADVTVTVGPYEPQSNYERVIAVPFLAASGRVLVEGPEEDAPERDVRLPPGNYRLVAAQYVIGDEGQGIDLFFEPLATASERSSVIVADDALQPAEPLLETAEIAGAG